MAAAWLSSRHWYYYLFSLEAYCIEYGYSISSCGSLFVFPNTLSHSTLLKQQIQNGTNFEQGKSIVQGTRQREKL